MKLRCILVSMLVMSSAWAHKQFSIITDHNKVQTYGFLYVIPHPDRHIIEKNGWDFLHASAFDMVPFLELARNHAVPAIICVPDTYKKQSTIGADAPIMEGARVALTWASIYFRFFNTDVRIISFSSETSVSDLKSRISTLGKKAIPVDEKTSRDDLIYERVFNYHNIDPDAQPLFFKPCPITHANDPITQVRTHNNESPLQRVLITGGAGFIGSHLCKWFLDKGYHVIALDNLACSTTKNIEPFAKNPHFEFHVCDVSKPFDIEGPLDIVMHLASLPSPAFYYTKPVESMVSGLNGTKITLDLARSKKARYLFASTSEVYGDPEVHPQPEEYPGLVDPIGKRSQYDQSKRGAETLIKLYFEKYGMDIRVIRIFNTYGPGMQLGDGRVVTNFIRAALEGKAMTVYGTGEQTRSLCYISDNIDAITRIVTNDEIGSLPRIEQRVFNVGNPEEHTINDVAQYVNELSLKYLGRSTQITKIPQFDQTDPKVRRPDLTRTTKQTGYTPHVSFKEGLEKIFLEYYNVAKSCAL